MRRAQKTLGEFPSLGPEEQDASVPGTRRLVVGDYVLTYDVADTGVAITAIRHGRMRPPGPDEDFDYEQRM